MWNVFGGKLAWGPEAIVRDDPNFQGRGNPSSGNYLRYQIDLACNEGIDMILLMNMILSLK